MTQIAGVLVAKNEDAPAISREKSTEEDAIETLCRDLDQFKCQDAGTARNPISTHHAKTQLAQKAGRR